MPKFEVGELLEVPVSNKCIIDREQLKSFFDEHSDDMGECGCYVFVAIRKRTKEKIPIYVGKATVTFAQECFNTRNIKLLNEYLVMNNKSELWLMLIKHPVQRGVTNTKAIREMEKSLIEYAAMANDRDLINVQGTGQPNWSIRGVIRSDGRKGGNNARMFKEIFHLD